MPEDKLQKILDGDIRAIAHLITSVEEEHKETIPLLKQIYAHGGGGYVLGITGSPGVGKSTLIDQMIGHYRKQDKSLGVLAIDPSSPFTGGAVLGDRIRMSRHYTDPKVFIRSMATRGYLGGLSRATAGAVSIQIGRAHV